MPYKMALIMPLSNFILRKLPLADVMLRVPTVFVMDVLINHSFVETSQSICAPGPVGPADNAIAGLREWNLHYFTILMLRIVGFLAAFVVFILPTDMLIQTYKWLSSAAIIAFSCWSSYWTNAHFLNTQPAGDFRTNAGILFSLQSIFAHMFCCSTLGPRGIVWEAATFVIFILPSLLGLTTIDHSSWSCISMLIAALGVLLVVRGILVNVTYLYYCAKLAIQRNEDVMQNRGLKVLLQTEWLRLKVPHVLRLFWLIRFVEHVVLYIRSPDNSTCTDEDRDTIEYVFDTLRDAGKQQLVHGCDTVVAVLGMTSVVASVAHYLSCAVQQFLVVDDYEEKSFGTVSAILFFSFALLTGLTGLEPEKRFIRLYMNFCLLFTVILHFTHDIVNPLLMSLSASRNRSVQHHGRALLVCAFLLAFPCWLLNYLWCTHHISGWLLVVSAFSIEVTIKVIISLLIYALFMYDAYRNSFREKLDDYVYYVRATGNTIEFTSRIFFVVWFLYSFKMS